MTNTRIVRNYSGQALIELAIFGSMMIMVLGSLINFAMNADLEQQATMKAVRDAMWSGARSRASGVPDSESYIHIEDGIVPDPSNPFSLGSTTSTAGSWAAPSRSFRLGTFPNSAKELPRVIYKVNGVAINCPSAAGDVDDGYRLEGCTMGGFRDVQRIWGFMEQDGKYVNNPDTIQPIDKYDLIYGVGGSKRIGGAVCNAAGNCRLNLRLLDPNEGEIVSRDSAIYYCRQILNFETCKSQCLLTKKNPEDPKSIERCEKVCQQPMDPPPGYCDANTPDTYLNRDFAALFPGNVDGDIGLGASQTTSVRWLDTTIRKEESAAKTRTTSQVQRWVEGNSGRSFTYREKGGPFAGIGTRQTPSTNVSQVGRNVTNQPAVIWDTPHD